MKDTIYKNHPEELKILQWAGVEIYSEPIDNVHHKIIFKDPNLKVFKQEETTGNKKYIWGQLEFELFKARTWVFERIMKELYK